MHEILSKISCKKVVNISEIAYIFSAEIIGCPPRVSPLCDSNGHPAYNSAEFDLFYLIRLPSCASEVFFSPETDNRFEAVDAETLLEYFGLFRAALPLLIGIIVIGF